MTYRFEDDENVPAGVRRIALQQIDDALTRLREPGDKADEAVHEARKDFKKLRGLLRLVRKNIGEDAFDRENTCFRDAGRRLADLRDSYVMVKTLDSVLEAYADTLAAAAYEDLRGELAASYEHIRRRDVLEADALAEVATVIAEARERVAGWPLAGDDFDILAGGLRKVYKRGRHRMADALSDPEPAALHEWRKRVKYLWYHVRLMESAWSGPLDALGEEIHALSDYLGDDHDRAVLRQAIAERQLLAEDGAAWQALRALLEHQRQSWQESAFLLGRRIYMEEPDAFVARLGAYWEAWRS